MSTEDEENWVEWRYVGIDHTTGRRVRGRLHASSREDAIYRASEENGVVGATAKRASSNQISLSRRGGGSSKERLGFLDALVLSLSTGSPNEDALRNATHYLRPKSSLRPKADELVVAIGAGKTIAEAFASQSDLWGEDVAQIVSAGSESGNLPDALTALIKSKQTSRAIRKQVVATLRKPLLAVIGLLGLIYAALTKIIPRSASLFADDLDLELPALTQWSLDVGETVAAWGPLFGLVMAACIIGAYSAAKSDAYGESVAEFMLKLPLAGKILYGQAVGRAADVIAISLTANARPHDACEWAASSVTNRHIKAAMKRVHARMRSADFPDAMRGEIPPLPHEFAALADQSLKGAKDNGAHWRRYAETLAGQTKARAEVLNQTLNQIIPIVLMGVVTLIGMAIMLPNLQAMEELI